MLVSNLEKVQRDALNGSGGASQGDKIVSLDGDLIGGHTPLSEELQRVILAMRKVIERLQKENEKLRREALIRTREQTKVSQEGEGEKIASEPQIQLESPLTLWQKLVSENERLGRSLRRDMERNQQPQLSLKTAQPKRDRLENEVHTLLQCFNFYTWDSSGRCIHGW